VPYIVTYFANNFRTLGASEDEEEEEGGGDDDGMDSLAAAIQYQVWLAIIKRALSVINFYFIVHVYDGVD
jgi:hypothetical protein